jgi:hypothetical protein
MMKSIGNRFVTLYQRHETWFAAGILLAFGLLAYTPFIHKFGFYRDDWYMLWAGHVFGPQAIIDLFTFDRPFVGYVFSGSYRLLGENPLNWQFYSLGLRTLGTLGFFWILRRLWPGRKIETTTAAILFFIYPGFLQWANATTKSNQLTTYTLAILSICLTLAALQSKKNQSKVLYSIGAVVTAVSYWFLYEYMIGMEGMRLGIITLLVWREGTGKQWKQNIVKILKGWLPYFIPLGLHIGWRLFFFESGRQGMNVQVALSAYQSGPLRTIIKRSFVFVIDVFEAVFSAWIVPLNDFTFRLGPADFFNAVILSLVGIGIFLSYFVLASSQNADKNRIPGEERPLLEIILLGGATLLFTLAPVVAVGRDIRWDSGFDKYTLHVIAGAVLLIVGATSFLIRGKQKSIVYSLLIGIALASQFGNSVQWADFWADQRELWWQMSWRAPQLEEGTVLLVETPGKDFFEDYEIWGPANLIYAPTSVSPRVVAEVFAPSTLEKIRVGTTETSGLRQFLEYSRNFHHSLILSRPERTSCWHILDGNDPIFPQETSGMLYATVRSSKVDQIVVDTPPSQPPAHIFGAEPEHEWCYFFQKASFEAQRGEWGNIAQLADQALDAGFKPIDRSEWLPFLKGLVMVDRNEDAEEMALWIRDIPAIRHRQCDYLSDTALPDPARQSYLREILCN